MAPMAIGVYQCLTRTGPPIKEFMVLFFRHTRSVSIKFRLVARSRKIPAVTSVRMIPWKH